MKDRAHRGRASLAAAAAMLMIATVAVAQTPCRCDDFGGGHDCNGWQNTNRDCTHPGFVHTDCTVHSGSGCIAFSLGAVEGLEGRLAEGVNDAVGSGDPRILAAAVEVANESTTGAKAHFMWATGRVQIRGCGETVMVDLALSEIGTGRSRAAVAAAIASRGLHAGVGAG